MDINSIYEDYRLKNKQSEIVRTSFYTEKVKDRKTSYSLLTKIKKLLIKRLP
jgi:hypothetical protein